MCIFLQETQKGLFHACKFGLERESMRVNTFGYIADTAHPFAQSSTIDRDFFESQLELITPVCGSTQELYQTLLQAVNEVKAALRTLPGGPEYLWPFSNPPYIRSLESLQAAEFGNGLQHKNLYRRHLEQKYGKQMMLYSGIHYNFSLDPTFLQTLYADSGTDLCFTDYTNAFYLHMAAMAVRYSWLIVLLTAASPLYDLSFSYEEVHGIVGFKGEASIRNGKQGYWNQFTPVLDYSSLSAYLDSIDSYVASGKLYSPAELYLPVRIKPVGENTIENFLTRGIGHIELRMLDLNPLSEAGIAESDLVFLHYFLLYLAALPQSDFDAQAQRDAILHHKRAAAFHLERMTLCAAQGSVSMLDAAETFLLEMKRYFEALEVHEAIDSIQLQLQKVRHPEQRYANQVFEAYQNNYVEKALQDLRSANETSGCVRQIV